MEQRRVRRACARCKRQKLKCDEQRPCQLCLRSKAICTDADNIRRRKDRARRNEPQASIRPAPSSMPGPKITEALETSCSQGQYRHSTFQLVQHIFKSHGIRPSKSRIADAIPDGSSAQGGNSNDQGIMVPISSLVGIEFPSKALALTLYEAYLKSMNWYMVLFHEPTMRKMIEQSATSGVARRSEMSQVLLMLIIMVIGARFATIGQIQREFPSTDLPSIVEGMVRTVEEKYLPCIEVLTVDSVMFAYLLSVHYLSTRCTKRAFVVKAAALRAGQAMELHQESRWGEIDPIERQVRRRVWWMLFVSDGYSSQVYGKPSVIGPDDFHVVLPSNIDDNSATCPGFTSVELQSGSSYPVTIMSYHRYKSKLYLIAAPITRDLYLHKLKNPKTMVHIVKDIHAQLTEWENSLPPELKLDSWNKQAMENIQNSTSLIFAMQALTLQISYDNIQLLLHRPLMTYQGSSTQLNQGYSKLPVDVRHSSLDMAPNVDIIELGRSQCWKSALRTSGVDSYAPILRLVGNTPAATNVGIHCLTSGVMLGVLALSDPAGSRVQDCKRGIASLIKVPRNFGLKSVVWDQNAEILTDLMHVIAAEEVKAMLSQNSDSCESDILNNDGQPSYGVGKTATGASLNRDIGWERMSNSQSTMDITYERVSRSPSPAPLAEDTQTPSQPPIPLSTHYASYGAEAFMSQFDFSRDSRVDIDFEIDASTMPIHQHGLEPGYNGQAQFGARSLQQSPLTRNLGVSTNTFPTLDHPEQLWIWGSPFAFP